MDGDGAGHKWATAFLDYQQQQQQLGPQSGSIPAMMQSHYGPLRFPGGYMGGAGNDMVPGYGVPRGSNYPYHHNGGAASGGGYGLHSPPGQQFGGGDPYHNSLHNHASLRDGK